TIPMPPMAEPTTTPVRSGSSFSMPESATASSAAATANGPRGPIRGARLRGVDGAALAGEGHRVVRGVEGGDRVDPAAPGQHRLPGGGGVQPERVDGADAGDERALFHVEQSVAYAGGSSPSSSSSLAANRARSGSSPSSSPSSATSSSSTLSAISWGSRSSGNCSTSSCSYACSLTLSAPCLACAV